MSTAWKVGGAGFVLTIAVGAWYLTRDTPLEPIEVVTTTVSRQTIRQRVRGVGHVEPVNKVRVSANVSGDLLRLHIDEGQKVKRGDALADIDGERILARVKQAEATKRSAESQVALENAQLRAAKSQAVRVADLHNQDLATDFESDRAIADLAVIRARLDGARQRVAEASGALEEARALLQQTHIAAPIDGTVIAVFKEEGERIRGSDLSEDVLLELAPLHEMEIEVEIGEQDIVRVQVGQAAQIEIDALEGQTFPGRVMEIANSALIRNRGTEMETTTFSVKVGLGVIPEQLRSGMSAAVAIVTETKKDVLSLPIEAVTARAPSALKLRAEEAKANEKSRKKDRKLERGRSGRREKPVRVVFQVVGDLVEPLPIETGISSDLSIEILEGAEEGQEVVVGPYRALARDLHPGSPIKVKEKLTPKPDKELSGLKLAVGSTRAAP